MQSLEQTRRKLAHEINTNFEKGDLFITLTHKKEIRTDDPQKLLSRFLQRLRSYYKQQNLICKYIYITEHLQNRSHHNLIMTYLPYGLIKEAWGDGQILIIPIDPVKSHNDLACWLLKQPVRYHGFNLQR